MMACHEGRDGPDLVSVHGPADFAAAFGVSRETLAKLEAYAVLLERWGRVQDLVAPGTMPELWQRHFADSAQLLALAPEARVWVDLGSGAGFPGLVLAILLAGQPGALVHLFESNSRKCAFLRDVARQTSAPVEIHNERIESQASHRTVENIDAVTARALAPLNRLLGLAEPFLSAGAVGLFPKGRDAAAEIAVASKRWQFQCVAHPSRTDAEGRIVVIRQLASREGAAS